MITVTLFSRSDCHLCEQVLEDLGSLQDQFPHTVKVIDVDSTQELRRKYGFEVPVVEIGPYTLKAPITTQELQFTLAAARDRQHSIDRLNDPAYMGPVTWTRSDGFTYWMSKHYMAFFNLLVLIYLGLPFLAPLLMKAGAETPARWIYRGYGVVCHQLGFRSFYIFGEQMEYPRTAAGVPGLLTFAQATGLSEDSNPQSLLDARNFVGNNQIGYKIALCQRDVSIYGAILLFGLLFAASGRRLPALPWYLWIIIGILPIAWDGFSQLISQPPLSFLPYRESTPFLRVLTGGLFGLTTAWFGYPMVEETMADTRQLMSSRLERARRTSANALPAD
jgi:uncharacterized membrane protein